MWNINDLHDFHKICRICTSFQDALAVKVSLDLICTRGYGVMGVLIWRGLVTPKFSVTPSVKKYVQDPKHFKGARTCSRSSITMQSLVAIGFHPLPEQRKTLSFLSVRHALLSVTLFLSVTLLNVRVCSSDFTMKTLEYRNDFDAVEYGKVCSCVAVFNFLKIATNCRHH